jgi:hypothetical protein
MFPNPIRARLNEDPEAMPGIRRLDCRLYEDCLYTAATKDWSGWHCHACRCYQADRSSWVKDRNGMLNMIGGLGE